MIRYLNAVMLKEKLILKLNVGILNIKEWECDIKQMKEAGFVAMAEDLQKRFNNYRKEWKKIDDEINRVFESSSINNI